MPLHIPPGVEMPGDDARIWRYVGFSKYVATLASRGLHFSRIDAFEDRQEGRLPEGARQQYGDQSDEWFERNKSRLFVSCWHLNAVESGLMWKAYSNGEPIVALETSAGHLKRALAKLPDAFAAGMVQYLHFATDPYPGPDPMGDGAVTRAFYKRKFFEGEQEFRIILDPGSHSAEQGERGQSLGVCVKLPLTDIVERVRVVAGTPDWFLDTVRAVSEKFGLKKEVTPSEI